MSARCPLVPQTGLMSLLLGGGIAMFVLVGVIGGWAATTRISGAVTARGQIDVAGKAKTVQTLEGGILAELSVSNGDMVHAGQVVARLDHMQVQTNLERARARLTNALSLRTRLEAEQAGNPVLTFDTADLPPGMHTPGPAGDTSRQNQRAIFEARAKLRQSAQDQLANTLRDISGQIAGLTGQVAAVTAQLGYLDQDLANIDALVGMGLARQRQLSEAQRTRAVLLGQLAAHQAELTRLRNWRSEAMLEAQQAKNRMQEEIAVALRDVSVEIEELSLTITTQAAQRDRMDIRAPADGMVHEVQMTTVGGVVAPGGTLLSIIPQRSGVDFEVRVDPRSINQVRQNQPAQVVLSALDPQTTPRLTGHVRRISPEPVADQQTGRSFYRVWLAVPHAELARLPASARLIPGMPLEAFLETGERTVLSYLVDPISTHLRRGFRE